MRVERATVRLAAWLITFVMGVGLACAPGDAAQKARKEPPKEPLDLNTATKEELQKLPEVGPVTAEAIVRFREKSGPFRRVEDLLAVRGITKRRLEKMRPFVVVKEKQKSEGRN